ncbi:ABC transporter permease [Vibrio nigripulchritudo]|uniref:ABC transporter permease n=1 Tax=Vibrio nigripulchritudo TaxID=28173 RepID=UPI0005F9B34A|nr:ABC transporter permease [Vibrio nigripulchritudo]KJY72737.1 ABC transporter permease [Vibrio nigripulchritudo]
MTSFLYKRLCQAIFVAWSVGTVTFVLMRLIPGDIAYRIAAGRYGYDYVDLDAAKAVSEELGLDRPAIELYFNWLWELVQFNLGRSLVSGELVINELAHQLGHSILLATTAMVVSLLIAVPIGVYCGRHAGRLPDTFSLFTSIVMKAQPVFLIGLALVIIFALKLNWLPVAGFGGPSFIVLPAVTLALSMAAMSNRIIRNSTQQVTGSQYFLFARLKGLSYSQAFERHGKVNIALPVIAFIGVQTVTLIEGIVMVESLFSWPGIGHALSHAIFARDIPMIQGAALLMGLLFVLINTLVDVVNYILDPRLRAKTAEGMS